MTSCGRSSYARWHGKKLFRCCKFTTTEEPYSVACCGRSSSVRWHGRRFFHSCNIKCGRRFFRRNIKGYFGKYKKLLGAPAILLGAPSNSQNILILFRVSSRIILLFIYLFITNLTKSKVSSVGERCAHYRQNLKFQAPVQINSRVLCPSLFNAAPISLSLSLSLHLI